MTDKNSIPELDVFSGDVGVWEAVVEARIQPGAAPMVSRGLATNRLAHDGRWLLTDFQNETGFTGTGIYGFDVAKKKYTGVWVDSVRTAIVVMLGTYDPTLKTMTMVGEQTRADGSKMSWREVTELVDADTKIFRSFTCDAGGAEF